jgi:hypothetical protein
MATCDETEDVMSNAITIWRAIAVAAVGTAAQANAKVTFRDVLKPNGHERSKAEKLADGDACGTAGPAHELTTTLPVFEKCMRAKGWVLRHYTLDASVPVEGTVESCADTRGDAAGHPRGTHELHADTRACRASGAASINRCLADSGWRLMAKQRGPAARRPVYQEIDPTWIDPETGLRCHNLRDGVLELTRERAREWWGAIV